MILCYIYGSAHFVPAAASLTEPEDWRFIIRLGYELLLEELDELTDLVLRQTLQQ